MNDAYGEELTSELAQALVPIRITIFLVQDVLAVGGDILDDSLVAIINQRQRLNSGGAIPLVEERFHGGVIKAAAYAGAQEHQIAFFWRQDQGVPVNDVKTAARLDQ